MNLTNPTRPANGRRAAARRIGAAGRALGLGALLAALGCAGGSAGPACRVEVVALEKWNASGRGLDAAYRVRGTAGAPGVVSLVARLGPQDYITGPGVEVGPGPFVAIVDLKLTGVPPELLTLLEVGGERCSAKVRKPA